MDKSKKSIPIEPAIHQRYISPTPGEIPIICWGGFDIEKESELLNGTDDGLQKHKEFVEKEISNIVDAHFNAATAITRFETYKFKQQYIAEAGLNIIGEPPSAGHQVYEVTKLVALINNLFSKCDISQIKAWILGDEPYFDDLDEWDKSYFKSVEEWYPRQRMTYINLSVDRAKNNIGDFYTKEENCQGYMAYLDEMGKRFHFPVWCYDQYPLVYDKDNNLSVQDSFYENLEIFHLQAKKTNRPFWTFCQCLQLLTAGKPRTAMPTFARMRYEAFSALAYGSQGITFWSFREREVPSPDGGYIDFGEAPVNLNNERTPLWEEVKRTVDLIKKYNDVFLDAEMIIARHTGDRVWGDLVSYYDYEKDNFGPLLNISTSNLGTSNIGVLLTRLRKGNSYYLVVVNHSPYTWQNITLYFDSKVPVYRLDPPNETQITPGPDELPTGFPVKWFLAKGDFVVFRWNK